MRRTLLLTLTLSLLPLASTAAEKAEVEGRVTDIAGKPLAGVTVTMTSAEDASFLAQTTTDRDGRFDFKLRDPQGEYSFLVEVEGYAPFEGRATLAGGQRTQIDFKLLDAAGAERAAAIRAYNAGADAFNRKDNEAAEASFLEALEHDPTLTAVHRALAEIYYDDKRLDKAAAAVDSALAVDGDDVGLLSLAFLIHSDLGNTERTEALLDVLADTDRAGPLARRVYNDGVAALEAGDEGRAIERFRRASALDPNLLQAYSAEATLLYNAERFDEARAVLKRLLSLDPASVEGRRVAYLIHDALDDRPGASKAFEAYRAVDPDRAIDLLFRRAELDFENGRRPEATAALERIVELRPDSARANYRLGLCYADTDTAKARKHLERFLELAPDDPDAESARELLRLL